MGAPCAYRKRYVYTRLFGAFGVDVLVIYTIFFGRRFILIHSVKVYFGMSPHNFLRSMI